MYKNDLITLLYQYIYNTSEYYESEFQRQMNNYQRLVKFDIVSHYDILKLHECQVKMQTFKSVSSDLKKILEIDREF